MARCSQLHQWGHFCACISGQGCCPWAALGAHFCSVRGLVNVDLVERGLNLVRALRVAEFVKTEVCCWLCVVIVVLFKCPTKFMLVCCSLCYLDYIRVDRGEGKNHSSCVLSAHFLMKSFFCEFWEAYSEDGYLDWELLAVGFLALLLRFLAYPFLYGASCLLTCELWDTGRY